MVETGAKVEESARRRWDSCCCCESESDLVPLCCCSLALDNESLLLGLCVTGEDVRRSWNRDLEYKLSDLFGNCCACCTGLWVTEVVGVRLPRSGSLLSWLICEFGEDLADSEEG